MTAKRKFPTALLAVTLALAIAVSAVGWPGWAVSLFGKNRASKAASADIAASASNFVSQGDQSRIEGHSAAFTINPLEGITISAEENALDRDREFKMRDATEEEFGRLEASAFDALGEPGLILGAWELDAGLKDDEQLPGEFGMSFDLDALGVEKELYDAVRIYRVDDAGMWYEYSSAVEGSQKKVRSNQNSLIVAIIGWGLLISAPQLLSTFQAYMSGAYLSWFNGCFDVKVDGEVHMQIMLDRDTFIKVLTDGHDQHYSMMDADAKQEALQWFTK